MSERICLACPRPIDPSRRADAKVCVDGACRTWAQRHPNGPKRPVGPFSYVCRYEFCGKTFTRETVRGKRPRFCGDPCWESYRHYNLRDENYWRVENPYEPRAFTCVDCDKPGEDFGYGPPASRCDECVADYGRRMASQWQRENKERATVRKTAWAVANPDKVAASLERTKPQRYAAIKLYQQQNPDQIREWGRNRQARRRARQLNLPYEVFTAEEIFERDSWVCQLCDKPVDPLVRWPDSYSASLDHRIPISKGGPHTRANVQLAHLGCNVSKRDRIL